MLSLGNDLKILDRIIVAVTVSMMHVFAAGQLAADRLFHHVTVLEDASAVGSADGDVTIRRKISAAVPVWGLVQSTDHTATFDRTEFRDRPVGAFSANQAIRVWLRGLMVLASEDHAAAHNRAESSSATDQSLAADFAGWHR